MNEIRWSAVDGLFEQLLLPHGVDPHGVLDSNARAGLPPHDVSPCQGRMLEVLARAVGARRILEIGTLGGYSSAWLARALPHDGVLVTLERDEARAELARRNLASLGFRARVDVRTGDALETLETMKRAQEPAFDFAFLDADKATNDAQLRAAMPLLRQGALIVADNVVRGGAVTDPATDDASARGVRRFLELVGQDERLVATAVQTVGSKGWDGFALAFVASR